MGRWLAGVLVFAICALAAGTARAQSEPATGEDPASETVYRADEIVVEEASAPRPIEAFQDTPVEREVLGREDVERRPGTSAADLLRTLPGVRQQQRVQGEEAAVSIEGMPPEFTRALVDGSRYSGEIGAVDDFRTIPIADAERVEVLRGAQALRYGSEAAGGVVRVDTPTPPSDGWTGRYELGYGSADWLYVTGALGWGNERTGAWLRFVNDQIRGFEAPGDPAPFVSTSAGKQAWRFSRDVYGKLRFRPAEPLALTTRFGWRSDDESGLAGRSREGDREERRWLAAQHFDWTLGEATRLLGDFLWYQTDLTSDVGRSLEMREQEPSGRLALEHLLDTGPLSHALVLGFDAYAPRLDLDEGAFTGAEVEDPIFEATRVDEALRLGGVFALTESRVTDWLAVEGGLRAQFHGDYGPELLPQLALLVTPWQPDAQRFLRLRASWGKGYRTPSLRDLHQPPVAQLGGGYFLAGNPDLDPEFVTSVRLGFELLAHERVYASVSAFHNDIRDHIRSALAGSIPIGSELVPGELPAYCHEPDPPPSCDTPPLVEVPILRNLFVKTNLDSVVTRGVETRLRVRPHDRIDLELAYTYLDTELEDSNVVADELPNEPHHVVDVLLGLQVPRTETRIAALARWRGEALTETSGTGLAGFVDPDQKSDPSLTLDLRLVQPIHERLELYLDVFNLTDERFVDSYVVRGRTALVGLRGSFD